MRFIDLYPYTNFHEINLDWILKALKSLYEEITGMEDRLKSYIDDELSDITEKWQAMLDNELAEFEKQQDEKLDNAIQAMREENAETLAEIYALIEAISKHVQELDSWYKAYVDSKIAEVIKLIPEITSVMVVCPVDGKVEPIQDALFHIYDALRYGALTALEFDTLNLTAGEFDEKGITAFCFDLYGKCILWPHLRPFHMFSPFTGEFVPVRVVVEMLAALHRNGFTAQAFDNLELTAQEFDEKELTAYTFDWVRVS